MAESPASVVLSDIFLPGGMNGVSLCAAIREAHPDTEVILITAFGSLDTAIQGVKLGACDYLLKPFEDLADVRRSVARAAERVAERAAARNEVSSLRARAGGQEALLDRLPTAIIIADGGAKLRARNRAGALLLAQGTGLRVDADGRVRCAAAGDDRALSDALVSCCAGDAEVALAISRAHGEKLRALVASLQPAALGVAPPAPLAAVLVVQPERSAVSIDARILSKVHGLTPAEGILAARLAGGETVQDACAKLGISLATARTHLSRIFSKTGTGRQADLVRLILSGPALLAAGVESA